MDDILQLTLLYDFYGELPRRVIELNKVKPKAEEDDSWLPSLW